LSPVQAISTSLGAAVPAAEAPAVVPAPEAPAVTEAAADPANGGVLGVPAAAVAPAAPARVLGAAAPAPPVAVPTACDPAPPLGARLTALPALPEAGASAAAIPVPPLAAADAASPLLAPELHAALSATQNSAHGFEVNVRRLSILAIMATPSRTRALTPARVPRLGHTHHPLCLSASRRTFFWARARSAALQTH
jgi:hypothetical protein